jgi:phenylacetate-CoA ligase
MTDAAPAPTYSQTQRRFFNTLMVSQYWSPDEMRAYQRQQLESLLRHARATVPFYARRLDPVFRSDDTFDWERWSEIPIVTREDLLARRAAMQSAGVPRSHGRIAEFSTSGSTGTPVTTTHNASASLASNATVFRFYDWHGLDPDQAMLHWSGEDPADSYPEGGPPHRWGPDWETAGTGLERRLNHRATGAEVLEFLQRTGIRYLRCGGTNARVLAYEADRLKLRVPLDIVLFYSNVLTDYAETLVSEAFGARVIPTYSSKEGYKMAHRCPATRSYHVNSEIVFLEVLDSQGNPCRPGETGRVVITPLFSVAQPLIRYEQGDLATVGTPCPCGRHLQVLTDIVGRIKHVFRLPNGLTVTPTVPSAALIGLDMSNFQVAQVAERLIEVRYVPRDPLVVGEEQAVASAIRDITHPSFEVRFRRITSFDTAPGQKHQEYVSELSLPH